MLAVRSLSYAYAQRPVLVDADLSAEAGQVVCVIGPNGAGKSTLVKCIGRLLQPSGGAVLLHDRPVSQFGRSELARTIAYVPQQMGAATSLNVFDVVSLGRIPWRGKSSKSEDREVVWRTLKRLGLGAHAFRSVGELSGGERQRVLLARALAQESALIIMDEPANNLDPFYQHEMAAIVRDTVATGAVTVLLVLHDLSLAARVADSLVLMNGGRVVAQDTWRRVLTTANIEAAFGIHAVVNVVQNIPTVIPTTPLGPQTRAP